ncbi:HD domain-containing phosphohydrolase [Azospirillum halopraeferens]|uniref:HD domain-containing phosphohydrolase n=1 Tax=Azospirillum halopraeferens TaxID=34010 RepID=UPI0003F964A3|nr:HD domain-containing phosphohydrolase [Azospirillum halopraeferens]
MSPPEPTDPAGAAALFAALPLPAAHLDTRLTYLRVNRLFAEADGRTADAYPGRNHFDLHPDPEMEGILRDVAATGRPHRAEARPFRPPGHPEGDVAYRDWLIQPVTGADGRVGSLILTLVDVTRRVELEREHHAREVRLHRVNRALKARGAGNRAIIDAADAPALLAAMCRVLVEEGGYPYAGVEDAASGRPLAACGTPPPEPAVLLALPVAGEVPFGTLRIAAAGPDGFDPEERTLLTEMAGDLAFGLSVLRLRAEQRRGAERLTRSLEGTVAAIAATVELRDPYTAGHQRRVAELARAIARALGVSEDETTGIVMAATVHDIGKISVPAEILTRPGRLSPAEYGLVKAHVQSGYEILKSVDAPWPLADLVHQHHERLDGSGYPQGLTGEAILRGARIIAVADVVEAMACHRPYRPALGVAAALEEVTRHRGRLYDADAVDACAAVLGQGLVTL